MPDSIQIFLILALYWIFNGIFWYAFTWWIAYRTGYDIRSDIYVTSGVFFKRCLVLGPFFIFIVIWVHLKRLWRWARSR